MYSNLLFELTPALQSQRFLDTDLGKLHQVIPFKALASLVPLPQGELSGKGCKSWLTVEGGIALMIARHYLQLSDATCYESHVTYPTDAKLIWKCCQEVFALINRIRKQLKLRRSRANHDKYKKYYLSYAKRKKKQPCQKKTISQSAEIFRPVAPIG